MADTLNDTPDDVGSDEDRLYNMSMDELESTINSSKVEQPEEDSTDDIEVTDDTEEEVDEPDTDSDEESDQEDNPADEQSEKEIDQPTDVSTEKEEPQAEVFKIKAVGTEIEFTLDELKELASKGLDYTKKMQEIAPWKKQIAMMKEHSVSQDDVNLLIDLKKGNKDAVLSLMKDNGIDPLDVDIDTVSYRPNDYSTPDTQLALREVVNKLATDRETYVRTEQVVDKEWDSVSRARLLADPSMLEGLHGDIKSGLYDKVIPTALKLKALDGGTKTDLEYYVEAGRRYVESTNKQLGVKRQSQQEDINSNSQRRKAASLPKTGAGKKKDVVNYLDEIPDEDYEKWLKKVESKF